MSLISLNVVKAEASNAAFTHLDELYNFHGDCQFSLLVFVDLMEKSNFAYDTVKAILPNVVEDCVAHNKPYRIMQYVNVDDETMLILTSSFDYKIID